MVGTRGRVPDRGTRTGGTALAYAHLHTDAVQQLSRWRPPDADQERLRLDYLEQLARHPDAVAKQGPPEHLTASVLVMDPTGQRVLLTHHRRANAWFQFGGHLEPGDRSLPDAATREGREESGIADLVLRPGIVQLDRHALAGDFGRCREHLDVRYLAVVEPTRRYAVSAESRDVRWVAVAELPEFAPTVVTLAAAAQVLLGAAPSDATA